MQIEDYPLALKMKEVAKIMRVCVPMAYDIARRPDFPAIREGHRIIVPRDAFFHWFNHTAVPNVEGGEQDEPSSEVSV